MGGPAVNVKEELKAVLRDLGDPTRAPTARRRARALLDQVTPELLSRAEQELLAEGLDTHQLQELCDVHLEVLGEALGAQGPTLEPDHPIATLTAEHQIILSQLDLLERTAAELGSRVPDDAPRLLETVRSIVHHLLETESHHQREEQALFPFLEQHGITGPPRIMRQEHELLRPQKHALRAVLDGGAPLTEIVAGVRDIGPKLAAQLRQHIHKEDHILYPTALSVLSADEWSEVKARSDAIGYCCYTPGKQRAG